MSKIDKLSPRQRECLRLYWVERLTSKEIGQRLGIAPSTVDGYFAEAVQTMAAKDRREAALLAFGETPASSGGQPARVSTLNPWGRWLPLRTGAHNDLSIPIRLLWILVLTIGCAVGFGALASGVHLVNEVFR